MKYCFNCNEEFSTMEDFCPVCGEDLSDENEDDTMMDTLSAFTLLDTLDDN
ncbi:MAG: hypothetical protein VB100_09285 [Angelakisella sp.]|nr:hypothetical protein [Angelakisella sp.]